MRLCAASPGGIRCSSRPRASSIWPVRNTQPQPLSVVREQPARWGKPRLYVSHRSDAKARRKRSFASETVAELELTLLLPLGSIWRHSMFDVSKKKLFTLFSLLHISWLFLIYWGHTIKHKIHMMICFQCPVHNLYASVSIWPRAVFHCV